MRPGLPDRERHNVRQNGIYQRLFLLSRGVLPFAYLSPEQVHRLSAEQRHRIENLRNDLQLQLLKTKNFNKNFGHQFWGINEMFKHFYKVATLPR